MIECIVITDLEKHTIESAQECMILLQLDSGQLRVKLDCKGDFSVHMEDRGKLMSSPDIHGNIGVNDQWISWITEDKHEKSASTK